MKIFCFRLQGHLRFPAVLSHANNVVDEVDQVDDDHDDADDSAAGLETQTTAFVNNCHFHKTIEIK